MLKKLALILFLLIPAGCKPKLESPSQEPAQQKSQAKKTPTEETKKEPVEIDPVKLQMFQPLPEVMASEKNPVTEEKINLGRMLYYDKRLSKNHNVSCNSCHKLDKFGVDNKQVSTGHKGQKGDRNSPTVYNAAGHIAQFWDGRAADVEEQAKKPILNPVEMAMPNEESVIQVLKSIPSYDEAFTVAFPKDKDPVTYDNMAKAIGAFERKLVTPSRWDQFLQGDKTVLTDEEKAGFNNFMKTGCQTCHMGPYVGGLMYQKLGVIHPWPDTSDLGRYKVTEQAFHRMMFKVPSLRDVEKTGPYFHDGKVKTLNEVVKLMAWHQLGKKLDDDEIKSIIAWLKTLTGEIPQEYIKKPELPKSTKETPKPDPS